MLITAHHLIYQFLAKLEQQFAASAERHSIFLTKKRLSATQDAQGDSHMKEAKVASSSTGHSTERHSILIRVTDGQEDKKKKVKFSTVVSARPGVEIKVK